MKKIFNEEDPRAVDYGDALERDYELPGGDAPGDSASDGQGRTNSTSSGGEAVQSRARYGTSAASVMNDMIKSMYRAGYCITILFFALIHTIGGRDFSALAQNSDPLVWCQPLFKTQVRSSACRGAMRQNNGMNPSLDRNRIVVWIDAELTAGTSPMVTGKTNLPDGMKLTIQLAKPWLPDARQRIAAGTFACDRTLFSTRDCIPITAYNGEWQSVIVKDGKFTDGPFTDQGAPLPPGKYVLEITSSFVGLGSTSEIKKIIGDHGENLAGPLINTCCFRSTPESEADKYNNIRGLNDATPNLGASIYFGKYVTVAP